MNKTSSSQQLITWECLEKPSMTYQSLNTFLENSWHFLSPKMNTHYWIWNICWVNFLAMQANRKEKEAWWLQIITNYSIDFYCSKLQFTDVLEPNSKYMEIYTSEESCDIWFPSSYGHEKGHIAVLQCKRLLFIF